MLVRVVNIKGESSCSIEMGRSSSRVGVEESVDLGSRLRRSFSVPAPERQRQPLQAQARACQRLSSTGSRGSHFPDKRDLQSLSDCPLLALLGRKLTWRTQFCDRLTAC